MIAQSLQVPYWWHATLVEVMWLFGGLVALPVSVANLADARRDKVILAAARSDPSIHSRHYFMLEQAAKGRSLDYWLTVVSSCLIVATGIVACLIANPLGGSITITALAVTACLDGIAAVNAARSYAAYVRRQRLYELAAGRSAVIAAEMRARNLPTDRKDTP